MRFLPRLMVAVALLVMTAQAEEKAGLDADFQNTAIEGKASVREMIGRLESAAPRLGSPESHEEIYFGPVFGEAVKRARGDEWQALEALLRTIPHDSFIFTECVAAYASVRIRQRVTELAKHPVHISFPPSKEPLLPELANAPAADREAWALYNAVFAPYLAVVLPEEKIRPPRKGVPELEADLPRVIGAPEPGAWKHLAEHVWRSWCGTGSEALYHPRNRALLLSFLADGKLKEAAGAALGQAPTPFIGSEPPSDVILVHLLTALGIDWEKVMYGSLLPVKAYEMSGGQVVIARSFEAYDAWTLLSTRGSDRAVRQCLDLIRRSNLGANDAAQFLAAVLGSDAARQTAIPAEERYGRTTALSARTRREALAVMADYLAPTRPPADVRKMLEAVPPQCVKELRKPIGALFRHRRFPIASKALMLLRQADLTTGEEKIVDAPPPLLFRLRLNGQPLVNVSGQISARSAPESGEVDPARMQWLGPEANFTTDINGDIRYSIDDSLEPERIRGVWIHMRPVGPGEIEDLPGLPPLKGTQNEWPGPWINQWIVARGGDSELHEVELQAADLEVKITAPASLAPDAEIQITLREAVPKGKYLLPSNPVGKVKAQAGGMAYFRQLQPGNYKLLARAPGMAYYDSGDIRIGDRTIVHEVKLEPGRAVRATVIFPDGSRLPLPFGAHLFRDGVEIPRPIGGDDWEGLAFGKYTVHIRSTREEEEEQRKEDAPVNPIHPEDRVAGRDVTFVIDESTTSVLDLGEIVVPREQQ